MSNHIKINGVCVGMTKSEAWDLLQPLHVYKCEPMSISTIGTTDFAGAQVSINYLFDSSFVINKIHILWTKKEFREGSLIGKVSKNDLGSVYASFTNYFNAILPAKERGAKIYSKDATYMDLYNHVYVSKQDARDEGNPKFECVLVQLTDFIDHLDKDDKDKVRYARNLFIHTREDNIKEKSILKDAFTFSYTLNRVYCRKRRENRAHEARVLFRRCPRDRASRAGLCRTIQTR